MVSAPAPVPMGARCALLALSRSRFLLCLSRAFLRFSSRAGSASCALDGSSCCPDTLAKSCWTVKNDADGPTPVGASPDMSSWCWYQVEIAARGKHGLFVFHFELNVVLSLLVPSGTSHGRFFSMDRVCSHSISHTLGFVSDCL